MTLLIVNILIVIIGGFAIGLSLCYALWGDRYEGVRDFLKCVLIKGRLK